MDFVKLTSRYKKEGFKNFKNEELVEMYPTAHTATKLSPNSFWTKMFAEEVKEEILKRMTDGR